MKDLPQNIRVSLHKPYSIDGIELDSILFEPKKSTDKIIIHVHGKEGHFIQNHFVTTFGNTFPKYGYSFLTFNNRGHDYIADLIRKTSTGFEWIQGGSSFDIIEDFTLDIQGIINYVLDLGYKEIILEGHSIGPHKICYYMTHCDKNLISKIILISTSDIMHLLDTTVLDWQKWSFIAKKMIDEEKGKEIMPIKLWSNCPVSAATFWNYTNPNSNYFVFNNSHPDNEYKNFNKITLPILVINPENDFSIGVKPEKAIDLLKKSTISKNFTAYVIKNAIHNFLSKEEELSTTITNWLNRV